MSPAQKLYRHPVQDSLHAHGRSFTPERQRPIDTQHVLQKAESFYDQHAYPLPDLALGAHVAIQKPTSKAWDIYGTITAVSPHRWYFIRTQSGRVLVRNRHFLRKRTALSVHAPAVPAQVPLEQQQCEPPPAPRRSGHKSHRPDRLIEDNTWG